MGSLFNFFKGDSFSKPVQISSCIVQKKREDLMNELFDFFDKEQKGFINTKTDFNSSSNSDI